MAVVSLLPACWPMARSGRLDCRARWPDLCLRARRGPHGALLVARPGGVRERLVQQHQPPAAGAAQRPTAQHTPSPSLMLPFPGCRRCRTRSRSAGCTCSASSSTRSSCEGVGPQPGQPPALCSCAAGAARPPPAAAVARPASTARTLHVSCSYGVLSRNTCNALEYRVRSMASASTGYCKAARSTRRPHSHSSSVVSSAQRRCDRALKRAWPARGASAGSDTCGRRGRVAVAATACEHLACWHTWPTAQARHA